MHDQGDLGLTGLELSSQIGTQDSLIVESPDLAHLIVLQYRPTVALAARGSTLGGCVGVVVGQRSEKQVVWSDAEGRVAAVQHAHAVWDLAMSQDPCRPVSPHPLALGSAPYPDLAVPIYPEAGPQPASGGLLDPTPEPFSQWSARASHGG